jgi:ribosomal protein S18 acetylase RimI-like enzyme
VAAEVTVRRLGPEEWRTARTIRLRALEESPRAFASSLGDEVDRPDTWWIEGMTKLAWFVAEERAHVVGVVAGMPLDDHTEVISMWVEPDHRGGGVAEELLSAVAEWAGAKGDAGLCLAVASDNERARRFYERAGFSVTGAGQALRSRPEVCTTEMRLEFGR